eukprot:XP_001693363.1 predicted protein [Chlamydomonas reinhardtii]
MHCANDALQLGRQPHERFRDAVPTPGAVHCLICRETRVDCRLQTPESAYLINHALMAVMDVLGMGGHCRACDEECGSQAALLQHYLKRCPHAVVRCRFRGCSGWHRRSEAQAHEDTCPIGRAACSQCGTWVDRQDVLRHMVTTCRMRVVNCVLCKHSCRLPDMLRHLREHQHQLAATSHSATVGATGAAAAGAAWQRLQKPGDPGPSANGAEAGEVRLLSGGAAAAVAVATAAAAAGQGLPRVRSVEDAVAEAAAALAAIQHQQLLQEASAATGAGERGVDEVRGGSGTQQGREAGDAAGAVAGDFGMDRGSGSSTGSADSGRGDRLAAAAAVTAPPPPLSSAPLQGQQQEQHPQQQQERSELSPQQDMQGSPQLQQFTTQEVQQQAQQLLEQLLRRQQRRLQERAQDRHVQQQAQPPGGGSGAPAGPQWGNGVPHQHQQPGTDWQRGNHGYNAAATALVPGHQTPSLFHQQHHYLQQQLQLQLQLQQQRHVQLQANPATGSGLPGPMAASLAMHLVRQGAGGSGLGTAGSATASAAVEASSALVPPRTASAGGIDVPGATRATVMGLSSTPDTYPLQQPHSQPPIAGAHPVPAQSLQQQSQTQAAAAGGSGHSGQGASQATRLGAVASRTHVPATAAASAVAPAPAPRASTDLPAIPGELQLANTSAPGPDEAFAGPTVVSGGVALPRPPVAADARSAGSYRNLNAALAAASARPGTAEARALEAAVTGASASAHARLQNRAMGGAGSSSSSTETNTLDRLRRRAAFWDSAPYSLPQPQQQGAASTARSTAAAAAAGGLNAAGTWAGGDALRGLMGVEGEDPIANAVAAAAAFAAAMGPGTARGGDTGSGRDLLGSGRGRASSGGFRGGSGPPSSTGRDAGAGVGIGMAGALGSNLYAAAAAQAAQAVQAMQAALAAQAQAEEESEDEEARLLRTAAAIVRVSAANAEERRSARQQQVRRYL